MDTPRKLIVGYDLCNDFTQISCYSYKTMEPIPIGIREGEDNCQIPTVLCVKTATKQWLFGDEAIACANDGAGILLDHLLKKVQSKEELELFGIEITGATLLEKFMRKTLTLIKNYFPTEVITKLVVTVQDTEPLLVEKIYEVLSLMGIEKERTLVMNHASAYLYYALSQDKSLWLNDVGLFDYNEKGLNFYQISMNRRYQPMIAGLAKTDYTEMMNMGKSSTSSKLAYIFENIANTALHKQIVSTLYFTGNGFEGGWADEVIKSLCVGRRVFFGQNLFTKGACYAAKGFSEDRKSDNFIFMSDDMITSFVQIRVYFDTTYKDIQLTEAGENWYEVNKNIEVIPEGTTEIEIVLKNIMTRETTRHMKKLEQLPDRPDRMTRLLINLTCRDKSTGVITITDLGFGEIYEGTGQIMQFTLEI